MSSQSSGPHAVVETPAPLVYGIVNNALLHSSPTINHTLPQIVQILHFCLVGSLLHYTPDFMFNWIEVGVLGRSKICRHECRCLALKEVDRLARPMRWGTVLLKDEEEKNSSETWRMAGSNCCDSSTSR